MISRDEWFRLVYGHRWEQPRPDAAARALAANPSLAAGDLRAACALGDEQAIARAIESDGEWMDTPGGYLGMPPLAAITFSSLVRLQGFGERLRRCAKLLLDAGADPDQAWACPEFPGSSFSALYGAAGRNHDAGLTRLLLDYGANPDDGESLYHSLEGPDLTITRMLLEAGASVDGSNALAHSLDFDHLEALQLLLESGADPDLSSENLVTPLHHAIRRGRARAHIEALLDAGADPTRGNARRTALIYGRTELVKLLPESEPESPAEALLDACAALDRDSAAALVAASPNLISALSEPQRRMLPDAAQAGNGPLVRLLVELGWPVSVRGGDWSASAINHAVFRGDAALVRFLLEHGASWTERHGHDDDVAGTLSFASTHGAAAGGDWLGCARALLEHGMPAPSSEYRFSEDIEAFFGRNPQPL